MPTTAVHAVSALLAVAIAGAGAAGEKAAETREKERDSYSLGYEFGGNLRGQPIDLDLEVIVAGIRDAYAGKEPRVADKEMQEALVGLKRRVWLARQKRFQEAAAQNLATGVAFLAENAKKEGVVTLPSGLQYRVLREGHGPSPEPTDSVGIHYRGTFVDGTQFDTSYVRGEPAVVHVFGVMKGWAEALQRMKVGAKWEIFVPSALAYGERGHGRIPPNSVLIFELELLSIADSLDTAPLRAPEPAPPVAEPLDLRSPPSAAPR